MNFLNLIFFKSCYQSLAKNKTISPYYYYRSQKGKKQSNSQTYPKTYTKWAAHNANTGQPLARVS
jgi:hypothetical protein